MGLSQSKHNVFVFGDFNLHDKDWLTYSVGTNRPGYLCYKNKPDYLCYISNNLIQMINFPWIPDCGCHSPALLDLYLPLTLVFVLQWLSLHWESLIMFLSQFLMAFLQKGMLLFIEELIAILMILCNHLRVVL